MSQASLMNAEEVSKVLGVSKSKAYDVIRQLNKDLQKKGFLVITGKVSRKYLEEKIYGVGE